MSLGGKQAEGSSMSSHGRKTPCRGLGFLAGDRVAGSRKENWTADCSFSEASAALCLLFPDVDNANEQEPGGLRLTCVPSVIPSFTLLVALAISPTGTHPNPEPEREAAVILTEEWSPSCLMAVPSLAGINDPDDFEHAAFIWLSSHEEGIAREIASRRGMRLVRWWHDDSANYTPYGSTVVVLRPHNQ